MATVDSIAALHTQLDIVCSSLESIFRLAGQDHEDLEAAAFPALMRFRDLLDQGDTLINRDSH